MEGARMYSACAALKDCLLQLGVGIDGGKDSITMAAQVNNIVGYNRTCSCYLLAILTMKYTYNSLVCCTMLFLQFDHQIGGR